ncbi:MAG TPA: LysR family transcriptional regulator [Paenalcaligenes sp.]|nr:LysR family transcriptional regulator [Paenalcaligenes sp.]
MQRNQSERLWTHVHSLIILSQQGSFTAAAQRLHVSKATVSQRITELERTLGVKLVHRTTRSVQLTDAGRQLVEQTQNSYQHISAEIKNVESRAHSPKGLLRMTAPVALAQQYIIPGLPSFLKQYPDIQIELEAEDRIVSLSSEGFDLAVRHTQKISDSLVAWRLAQTYPLLVASPEYLAQHAPINHPSDLTRHELLHYPRQKNTPSMWSFVPVNDHENEPLSIPIQPRFAVNNSQMLSQMALQGLGIALVPDFSASEAIQSKRLKPILPQWQVLGHFGTSIYAVRPFTAQTPQSVRYLVRFLQGLFDRQRFD